MDTSSKIPDTDRSSYIGVGFFYLFIPGSLKWFGHLPGDIRIQRENFRFISR